MPDTLDKCCARCRHWQTDDPDHAAVAPCVLGAIPRPEFWQGCREFTDRERATAEMMQQSQTRGAAVPYFGRYIMGVMP